MCTLKHAFDANNLLGLVFKIVQGKFPPIPERYSPALRALVDALLHKDPSRRPTTAEVLSMPILAPYVAAEAQAEAGADVGGEAAMSSDASSAGRKRGKKAAAARARAMALSSPSERLRDLPAPSW